jgi:hypothetical protein
MKKYNKLVVAGCSVSDRGNVDFCYGDKLAEMLDCEYDHQGAGCGSNFRIWRTITTKIRLGEIDKNTLIVIQYTCVNRKEFWTSNFIDGVQIVHGINLRDEYDDGELIRFKSGSHEWQWSKSDSEFFKLVENEHTNAEYDAEIFVNNHYNFIHMLQSHDFNYIFLDAWNYVHHRGYHVPSDTTIVKINSDNFDSKFNQDLFHFNNEGHIEVAKRIYNAVKIYK